VTSKDVELSRTRPTPPTEGKERDPAMTIILCQQTIAVTEHYRVKKQIPSQGSLLGTRRGGGERRRILALPHSSIFGKGEKAKKNAIKKETNREKGRRGGKLRSSKGGRPNQPQHDRSNRSEEGGEGGAFLSHVSEREMLAPGAEEKWNQQGPKGEEGSEVILKVDRCVKCCKKGEEAREKGLMGGVTEGRERAVKSAKGKGRLKTAKAFHHRVDRERGGVPKKGPLKIAPHRHEEQKPGSSVRYLL